MSFTHRTVGLALVTALLLVSGAALADLLTWDGFLWNTQPVPGYTSGTVSVPDANMWVYTQPAGKITGFLPYNLYWGLVYQERYGLAKLMQLGPLPSFMVKVYDGQTSLKTGWSVVVKNSAGQIIDFGIRPFYATGKVIAMQYDGSSWAGNNYLFSRTKTGNDYYQMTFTKLGDGKVQVDLLANQNGSIGSTSWTTPAAFGDIEEIYLVSAASDATSHYYKYTDFIPEPSSLLALGAGIVGLAGFALRRRSV